MLSKEQIALLSPAMRQEMALEHAKQAFWHSVLAQQEKGDTLGSLLRKRIHSYDAAQACALVIAFSTPV